MYILFTFSIQIEVTGKYFSVHVRSADLFPALEKRTCDLRWEVRDSALEFITQMTASLRGKFIFLCIVQLFIYSFYVSCIFITAMIAFLR